MTRIARSGGTVTANSKRAFASLIAALALLVTSATSSHAALHPAPPDLGPGVSHALAQWRSRHYEDVRYRLSLSIEAEGLRGSVEVSLLRRQPLADVVLDWRPVAVVGGVAPRVLGVRVAGKRFDGAVFHTDHIVIPAGALPPGRVVIAFDLIAPIAASGTAITRFRDRADDADYVYSLFVPADASTVFPCFDQPDLKARFRLDLETPRAWTAVSNAPGGTTPARFSSRLVHRFEETVPISTYLFAFAAGPFDVITDTAGKSRLFVRHSQRDRAAADATEVLRLNRAAVTWFEDRFAHAFPFSKYDLVLIPELAYGGMEHAGATFLREDAIVFPSQPTDTDLLRRALLVFHETSHQWFGDLVTMRWFDDLWLKEGFANYMAAKAAEAILPGSETWTAFNVRKSEAVRTDATRGTVPVRQALDNLDQAKSAYGNIVYNKAPAVLRQAEFLLGDEVMTRAVRAFVREHAFGVAEWGDLVRAFEVAAGHSLETWAAAWVTTAGLPTISTEMEVRDARIERLLVRQDDPARAGRVWPQRLRLLLWMPAGELRRVDVMSDQPVVEVAALHGAPAPGFVFANGGDFGYGRLVLDAAGREAIARVLASTDDVLLRSQLWQAAWETVRDAAWPPAAFIANALAALPRERDARVLQAQLGRLQTALRWYVAPTRRAEVAAPIEAAVLTAIDTAPDAGTRILLQRAFLGLATTPAAFGVIEAWLDGARVIPDVRLTSRDRFRMIQSLIVGGRPGAAARLEAQAIADGSDDGRRLSYATAASLPDAKDALFESWLPGATRPPPEAWIEEALGPFNVVEQQAATGAHLPAALAAVTALRSTHRIFFVDRWLEAFIGGQDSSAALAVVEAFAADPALAPDLRRKVLEAADALQRTVAIRARFGAAP